MATKLQKDLEAALSELETVKQEKDALSGLLEQTNKELVTVENKL
jgi:uncharacterized protein (DUF3084 family)